MLDVFRRYLVLLSGLAVAVTVPLWLQDIKKVPKDELESRQAIRKARLALWNKPLTDGRCAIATAYFGPGFARLVRADKDGTAHYAVLEGGSRKVPMNALYQGDWLRARFGAAETVTLATFKSSAAALARASQLCPPRLRCLPGRPGCDATPPLDALPAMTGLPAASHLVPWEGARPVTWPSTGPAPASTDAMK